MEPSSPYYFFTQVHLATSMKLNGAESYELWYVATRDQLLKLQNEDGSWTSGSQEPEYITASALIALLSAQD